jgi:hypothetical protein
MISFGCFPSFSTWAAEEMLQLLAIFWVVAATNRLHLLDARRIARVSETAVKTAFSSGPSVIVGGAQYFLRNREDVFRVFLYASRDYKIRGLISRGTTQAEAIEQIDTTDKARAAFVPPQLEMEKAFVR